MHLLTSALSLVSNALLLPVIVGLLLLLLVVLITFGGTWASWVSRLRFEARLRPVFASLKQGEEVALATLAVGRGVFSETLEELIAVDWDPVHAEFVLGEALERVEGVLSRRRLPVRLGPMFGLMGTLIPLGPALTGLAAGDIAAMAVNIQVAFATTVVGVAVGAIGFVVHASERRWLLHDLARLEYLLRLHTREAA